MSFSRPLFPSSNKSSASGTPGPTGPTGEGIIIIGGATGYGNMLVYDTNSNKLLQSTTLTTEPGPTGDTVHVNGNIIPTKDDYYSLGTPIHRWKDLNVGPGTVNFIGDIVDGTPQYGGVGLGKDGVVFTPLGFSTTFTAFSKQTTINNPIGPTGRIGWKVYPVGNLYDNTFDLVAQVYAATGSSTE